MKGYSILRFKRWPKIHHPLPQTPRESQQLLNALTSSFRRQLDAADTHKPGESADQHLESILNNPLFRVVPPKPAYHAPDPNNKFAVERIQKRPMAEFDDFAAAGILDGKRIGLCLNAQLALIGTQSADVRLDMKNTGAGRKVVEWFWASDSKSRKSFLRSPRAIRAALKFVVAEGLYDHINDFIRALTEFNVGGDDGKIGVGLGRGAFSYFLFSYLEAEVHYGRGLASAFTTFVQVADSISSQPVEVRNYLLKDATRYFIDYKLGQEKDNPFEDIPVSIFDDYCRSLDTIPGLLLWKHAMQIYHPKLQDARPLVKYVHDHLKHTLSSWPKKEQDLVIAVYLDAMRLLIDQERHKDALQLSPYIKHMLSEERSETRQTHDYAPQLDELMGRLSPVLE